MAPEHFRHSHRGRRPRRHGGGMRGGPTVRCIGVVDDNPTGAAKFWRGDTTNTLFGRRLVSSKWWGPASIPARTRVFAQPHPGRALGRNRWIGKVS